MTPAIQSRLSCLALSALTIFLSACEAPPPAPPNQFSATLDGPGPFDDVGAAAEWRARREVLLHAALYRTAWRHSVSGLDHFLLVAAEEDHPPAIGLDPPEFRRRILTELADLPAHFAWAEIDWRGQIDDVFPGTDRRAARLMIAIKSRDEEQATVTAEIADLTADAASSRQSVTAVWDGLNWRITPNGVRLIW